MTLIELAQSYQGSEREWISSLARFADDYSRDEVSVAVEAAIEQFRAARNATAAFEECQQTVRRLSAELRAAKAA